MYVCMYVCTTSIALDSTCKLIATSIHFVIWRSLSGLNPPPYRYLDLFSVVPSSTPRLHCVNSQQVCPQPVGILIVYDIQSLLYIHVVWNNRPQWLQAQTRYLQTAADLAILGKLWWTRTLSKGSKYTPYVLLSSFVLQGNSKSFWSVTLLTGPSWHSDLYKLSLTLIFLCLGQRYKSRHLSNLSWINLLYAGTRRRLEYLRNKTKLPKVAFTPNWYLILINL